MRTPGPADTLPLIDAGLMSPSGIVAIDDHRKRSNCACFYLYVADPGLSKILEFRVNFINGLLEPDGTHKTLMSNVRATWLTADSVGSIFFSDGQSVHTLERTGPLLQGGTPMFKPVKLLYGPDNFKQVNQPSGLTTDNFNLFWVNGAEGMSSGSVIKASELRDFEAEAAGEAAVPPYVVAQNADKVVGACIAQGNVYYTSADRAIYGVKKTGGATATIVEAGLLQAPKGCAWDGDGTVYLADEGGNTVYSFAGNMRSLGPTKLDKHHMTITGPFGLAVVQAPSAAALVLLSLWF